MINSISINGQASGIQATTPGNVQTTHNNGSSSFGEVLKTTLNNVNEAHNNADKMIDNMVTGKNTDIHNTMISIEQADLSFQLMTQIRNKLVAAYQEIYRMQV